MNTTNDLLMIVVLMLLGITIQINNLIFNSRKSLDELKKLNLKDK